MNSSDMLSPWIRRFLLEYLISVKNLSRNTQQSYRDTIRLLLASISKQRRIAIDQLKVEDLLLLIFYLIFHYENFHKAFPSSPDFLFQVRKFFF